MTEVRNDIPPPVEPGKRRAHNLPWRTIEVGESFFVLNKSTAVAGCYQQSAKLGRTFVYEARTETEGGKTRSGFRVWRTA